MKNNISIDELVRQGIAQGEEPHNLGAWANMDRMLDGKNPYQKEDKRKRKPWLFLLLGLLVCSTAVIGGYNYFTASSNNSNVIADSPSNSNSETTKNELNNEIVAMNHESNSMHSEIIAEDQDYDYSQATASNSSESYVANNPRSIDNISAINSAAKNTSPQTSSEENYNLPVIASSNQNQGTTANNSTEPNEPKSNGSDMLANIDSDNKIETTLSNIAKKKDISNKEEDIKNKAVAKNQQVQKIEPTITEKYLDTTNVTEVTHKLKKDEDGKKYYQADSFKYQIVKEKERTVVNPRYVALTKAQEEAAQRKTAIASNSATVNQPTMEALQAENPVQLDAKESASDVGLEANATASIAKKRRSFFSMFKQAAQQVKQKSINVAHKRFPIYTGMIAGVNAALINTQHNFGGFQAGLTAMTPLSRLFTIRAEARFIHQNNSGYTVKDNRQDILSYAIDSSSIFKTKIYNYQVDSVARTYNLQNFYTLQFPVVVSANIKKFTAYGGLNLNYGFRMNTKSSQSSNIIEIADTVSPAQVYSPRMSSTMKFTQDDFGSRLGLGYTVGGSYNVNPKLYIDLRMSNPIWDNTNGAAKQEISDVFFKIPSFQLSLGYRFRSYKPE